MTSFDSLSQVKEFLSLDAKRVSVIVELTNLKEQLESLNHDKPSVRSFERIEAKVDSNMDQLETASKAVSSYLIKVGGDPLTDSNFKQYCNTANEIVKGIDTLREDYHELLESKSLLQQQPAAAPVSQSELASALKALAESSEKQAQASMHHHKVPTMNMPIFNP